ncbi:MAG: exo-alpha-sialidase [Lentisphaerae bacterium]|nr:exo-alpha-sialidase [Lentisphaerota bacterium]MBT4819171.1 exo-alpha-sialidase [Lentisphaerota bacterium]MBT5604323.1 exo-alpha-sialidase [Lentisphaerota bacterium]MBT7060266.1 exo-alpha-sialidase [Lentisphaerota bacterium]MBT7847567.1 exo-alpha-sialidase [Lentisphaerota bacterium]
MSWLNVENVTCLPSGPEVHEAFPRMVRARNDDLLLFTRLGTSHASDPAAIVVRTSSDDGKTWSEKRELRTDPGGTEWTAHNPVAVVAPDGTVILWCSRYHWGEHRKRHCIISRSHDHGATWDAFEQFDSSPDRCCYYVTDAKSIDDTIMAVSTCFNAEGREPAFNLCWNSPDSGRTWTVVSQMTAPEDNLGDEVTIAPLEGLQAIVLLRGRRRDGTSRYRTPDAGKTWSPQEAITEQVGVLQRPLLTRLGPERWLLTGRQADRTPKAVVAYLSDDNAQTFCGPEIIHEYHEDGAYTSVLRVGPGTFRMAFYSDAVTPRKCDLYLATLKID